MSARKFMAGSLLLAVIGIGQPARAQEEADTEQEMPDQQARPRSVFASDEQFEQWFYGSTRGAERAAGQFESRLSAKIRELDRMYGLAPEQEKKLEIAGKRDIQRFFDSVREKKERLDRVGVTREEVVATVRELQVFRRAATGEFPFGEGSLLDKTLKKNLLPEQHSRYNRAIYRSRVDRVVSLSDERLGLSGEQHRRFVNLIVDETPPLKRYGEYEAYAVMFQASKLPEEQLKRILDEGQLRLLSDKFLEVRAFERVLNAKGYLDGEGREHESARRGGGREEGRGRSNGSSAASPIRIHGSRLTQLVGARRRQVNNAPSARPESPALEVITMRRRHILLLLVAMMLANLSMARAARAQDEAEPEKEQPAEVEPVLQMTDEQFEQWIFGKRIEPARRLFESWLEKEIDRADHRYRLNSGQKKKLEVAGRGDMKRLFDRFQEAKERLHVARGDFNQIGPILQELQAFQQAPYVYLFGNESMLAKTLKKTVTPEQIAAHEKEFYRSRVEWMVSLLDTALVLKADQHRRFVTLIVEETPPLKRYGNFDYDAVMWQASKLPQDKIKPIFDDAQLTKLLVRFGQANRMETILFGEGYLPAKLPGAGRSSDAEDGSKRKAFEDRSKRGLLIGAGQTRRD